MGWGVGPASELASRRAGVDTFVYGLSRDDGLFYPSKVGLMFGEDRQPETELAAYWRVSQNLHSLLDRGLDPLSVLIDRSHEKGMDFIASLRMGAVPGIGRPELTVANGGEGYVHPEVRSHQLAVLEELSNDYDIDGLELDFTAAPGGSGLSFPLGTGPTNAPLMTELVRSVSSTIRARGGQLGVRVCTTPALPASLSLDCCPGLA